MLNVHDKGIDRLHWDGVTDNKSKSEFSSGSQRDIQDGKGRYDLIPIVALRRLARHYETGAKKYAPHNWEKGQPLSQYYNSAMRHLTALLTLDLSEDHLAAVLWNVAAIMHHVDMILDNKLPRELDDIGIIQAIQDYNTPVETISLMPSYSGVVASGMVDDWR